MERRALCRNEVGGGLKPGGKITFLLFSHLIMIASRTMGAIYLQVAQDAAGRQSVLLYCIFFILAMVMLLTILSNRWQRSVTILSICCYINSSKILPYIHNI